MSRCRRLFPRPLLTFSLLFLVPAAGGLDRSAHAKPEIRQAFFEVYPGAVGTTIDTVPSQPNHCGVCHWKFTGGGTRNPYGERVQQAIGSFPDTEQGRRDAILSIQDEDPDGDAYNTLIEVTDIYSYTNTPTFPGLTPANAGSVSRVDLSEIQDHLVPASGGDTTPPEVTVISPNGGETLIGNTSTSVQWTATDAGGISGVNLYLSLDNGISYSPEALGLSNTGSYTWFPANRPTTQALLLVEAIDNAFNIAQDQSDGVFTIKSPPGGIVPTTLRDFDMPGSQPFEAGILNPPEACAECHANYDSDVEPYFNWQGNMMSQASRDLLFKANMVIANQDAPDSGDLCLRCHLMRGWLQGRSVPTDGSRMLDTDKSGVACDLCHRMVDPFPAPENPEEDLDILAGLTSPAGDFGNAMATIDPTGGRRGPFVDADSGHPVLVSPFHREAALCGTCHNVNNPAFETDGGGNYVPNDFDTAATSFSAQVLGPVERTYSEWFYSDYNTPGGVYAPQFGGNRDYVATCQDCHMRDVTGQGCNLSPPVRTDLPLHDMTGGSTWLPGLHVALYPGEVNGAALQAGISRARYMLEHAAELTGVKEGAHLRATVTNNTGHKLPTGYPEGRRMWINVKFYDASMSLLSESGAYDPATGLLNHDSEVKIYEVEPGLDATTAPLVGVPEGPSFHFVLNNRIFKDNRIPPRGFTNAAYAAFGGLPVGASYADGQYSDDTLYSIPTGAASAVITLYYQSTRKEFVEFLRDENVTNTLGQEIFDLWNQNGKCPPEVMAQVEVSLLDCTDSDGDGHDAYDPLDCPTGDDCDDSDPEVHPGIAEVCDNQVDDDCNGLTDTDDPECQCIDGDSDGYGDPASNACTYLQFDCDDSNGDVHPGAQEICDNGIDDNCDGRTDDADPQCGSAGWAVAAPAEAAVEVSGSYEGSTLFNFLEILFLPIGLSWYLRRSKRKR